MKQKNKKPSKLETGIGLFILVVITGIATGVFTRQFQLNPAVISLHDELITEDSIAVSGDRSDEKNKIPIPEGMVSMSEPELFSPDTLYEKINGKAELYLSAGFNRLLCRRIKLNTLSELWMEAFVYEMKSPSSAFTVFSTQRREDGTPTEISTFSYQTENAVFLVHGSNYIEIISSEPSEEMKHYLFVFAKLFIQQTPSESISIPELSMFPKECSDLNRISLIPSSAFGFNKLDNIFTSLCNLSGKEVMVFISNRQTPPNAERLSSEYRDFLKSFGGVELTGLSQLDNSNLIEIFDAYELFFTSGSYFCGVHEAADRKTAEEAAVILFNRISEVVK
ncbi:MAG: DUF6599 family protein [Thermodesulfobacteriota bacterium]